MPKDTKTLCIKKGCASVLTQPLVVFIYVDNIIFISHIKEKRVSGQPDARFFCYICIIP